jgi:hypothetical protein
VGSQHEPPPKNVEQALNHPTRGHEWFKSLLNEWGGLTDLGVLDHNYTIAQCAEHGITSSPVPITIVLDHKYDADGNITKRKARIAVRGTPTHMKPGIHYDPNTYAATPNMSTTKMLMALVVHLNLHQLAWDIEKAYVWAPLSKEDLIILKYPNGFERFDPETGEELFMIMRRNLYGSPNGARNYQVHRDKFILEEFNKNGWKCHKCTRDTCMFVITRDNKRTWLVAYVDDIDCASESKEHPQMIYEIMHAAWKCKIVPHDYMLGIQRTNSNKDGIRSIHMHMDAYVEGMYNTFKEYIPTKRLHTPCEHNMLLSMKFEGDVAEHDRVLKRGYQSAVGMLLWATRCVYTSALYTTGQLCKLMSKPTEEAWEVAMHLIAWMYQNKSEGITFRSDGNHIPFLMSDATNKGDPKDSKRAYGICATWMGGAILASSKKLEHCSSATAANEYMALSHATKHAVWMKALMEEMTLPHLVKEPTVIYADNQTANQWANEDT